MKIINKKKSLFFLAIALTLPMKCGATEYDINSYIGAGDSLINHTPAFATNDVLNIKQDLTASVQNIGSLGTINLTINGTNPSGGKYVIDGVSTFSGFTVNAGANYKFDNVSLNNFKVWTHGGAMYNFGTTEITNSAFKGSSTSTGVGGAICNGGTLTITNTTFGGNAVGDGNTAYDDGGAIYNYGTLDVSNSFFIKNGLNSQDGGAIKNESGTTITNCVFTENSSGNGGAIDNRHGNMTITDSKFIGNYKTSGDYGGGAIWNYQANLTVKNSTFSGNYGLTNGKCGGGAISNTSGSLIVQDSIFTGNYTNGEYGGAIRNGGALTITNSTFGGVNPGEGNRSTEGAGAVMSLGGALTTNISDTKFINNEGANFAGAIYNGYTSNVKMNLTNCEFTGNKVTSAATPYGGAAIYNNSGVVTVTNGTFNNNISTSGNGGAIFNSLGVVNLIADNGTTSFTGNKANGTSNAIYLEYAAGTRLNLNAGNNGTITFNDKIASNNINNIININKTGSAGAGEPPISAPTDGTVTFNETVAPSTINFYNGTMTLGNDSYLNGSNVSLNGGTLNMMNNAAGTANFNNLNLNGTTNLKIDADLANLAIDKITSTNPVTGAGGLKINQVNILSDASAINTSINFASPDLSNKVILTPTEAITPLYKYGMTYDASSGNMNFTRSGFNPAVLTTPVAALAGVYVNQATVYNEALSRVDTFMLLPATDRLLMRYRNKTASADGQFVFSPTLLPEEKGGAWVKQFTSFENVPLNNGPNVSSVGYGMLVGTDSSLKRLKHGFDGYLTAYMGYNGSHQNYDNVGVYQNGGVLGLTGTVYKGKFFSSLTANAGASNGNSYTSYGVDNFTTLIAGLASKTGYNIEFKDGLFILQPSFMMSYTFANTFDYTNAAGTNITSNPLNALQLMPGVKFISNLKNGWQPYLGLSMVFNIMDSQKFYANDVQLPQMSVNPYVEYGVGLQRKWKERFTGFGQVMARGGGRNGIAMQFGFRWAF